MQPEQRTWWPSWPCPTSLVLSHLRRGPADPSYRRAGDGTVWRATRTPEGPATLAVAPLHQDGSVHLRAWGAGAGWVLQHAPRMLGADDDPTGFEPQHPVLARLRRTFSHWRLGATGLLTETLTPVIIEQKVTGTEAFASYRALLHRFGDVAPGPAGEAGMRVPPAAELVARLPSWQWLQLGVDHGRWSTIRRAAAVAPALQRAAGRGAVELDRALRTVAGIGVWTSAETRFRVLGDADAVSFGDVHVAGNVTHALTGVVGDDGDMAALLAPYSPHRHRVQRLVELGGLRRPRRGPRAAIRSHLPAPTPGGYPPRGRGRSG